MIAPPPNPSPVVIQADAVIFFLVVLALIPIWILDQQHRAFDRELDEFWQSRVERLVNELMAAGYTEKEAYRIVNEMTKELLTGGFLSLSVLGKARRILFYPVESEAVDD